MEITKRESQKRNQLDVTFVRSRGTFLKSVRRHKAYTKEGKKETNSAKVAVFEADVFIVCLSGTQYSNEWILDSGCSYHMTPNKEWFEIYEPLNGGSILM